jgi:polyphosphate glucokinase
MNVLVVDVGGTHIKLLASGQREPSKIDSGPTMTAAKMVAAVKPLIADWSYDVVSIGYPGPVLHGRPLAEPRNLGSGWVGFDFRKAFRRPVKIVNDAAMQALGSYRGGRMLFLGLGTGLGCALVVDGRVEPMEIAHLPYQKGGTYEDYVGARGLARLGKKRWRRYVKDVVKRLRAALAAELVVLGGGNAKLMKKLPVGVRLGSNENAFRGGFKLWAESQRLGRLRRPAAGAGATRRGVASSRRRRGR